MKYIICLLMGMTVLKGFSQNVGVGTVTPVTKLDVAGGNNWDLVNGEGDIRLGNSTYRLKIGLATGGGGAGATGIMQYGAPGGYNVLSLGSQGVNLLQLNGGLTNVTISNYPVSMAAGSHTIQFKANHITPSTNTGVQAIYSTIIVKPN